jgi:nondiscriminating aspartyl-tRNA synthetase
MERTHIQEIPTKVGESVKIAGFVHAIRNQGSIKFIILRDVTGLIQNVVLKSSPAFAQAEELSLESVVEIEGLAKAEKQAPGGFEIEAQNINILSKAAPELPIPVVTEKGGEETNQPQRLDYRWLDLRKPENTKIFKVWTAFEKGARDYFTNNGFIQFYSPSFMNAASESGSEVFEVQYFDRKAYLAQSPQFYKQMAMSAGFEKVFAFGPVFRAEPSFTTRHMTEFTGWDFEISYIDSHHDVMDTEEGMLVEGFKALKETVMPEIEIPARPFPRIPMVEAKKKLAEAGIKSEKEHDLSPEEEREICRLVKEETGHDFVFITDYHISIRPFYHMRHADEPDRTKSFDLLYKGIEITTGAQREHRVEILEKQAVEKGMNLEELTNYINFFRYGVPPHGGVGIGPGRIIMQILDLANIREATFLPRDVKRLTP